MRPVAHSDEILIPVFKESVLNVTDPFEHQTHLIWIGMITFLRFLINHNCLIKRSWMTWLEAWIYQKNPQVLTSRLKDKNLLDKDANVTFCWNRDAESIPLFNQILELVYCSDMKRVLMMQGVDKYDPNSWRLFIDSSKCSLKCVLLHSTNKYASVPIGHLTLKEKYDQRKQVIEQIK